MTRWRHGSTSRFPSPLPASTTVRSPASGFVLIAVLWFVAALATLTTVYTFYLHSVAPEVVFETDRLRAHAVEVAGVELAAAGLLGPKPPPIGHFSFHAGDAEAQVSFRAEAGFIDLNFAPKETLAALFIEFGAKEDQATALADRIVGWRAPVAPGAQQVEAALYSAGKRTDAPRLGPFQHVDELSLVLGAPPDLVESVLPFLTVFSGRADVNDKAAPPEVVAVLPKTSAAPAPAPTPTADASDAAQAPATPLAATTGGNVNRVTVDVRLGPKLQFRAEAVILQFTDDSEPYRLLSWRD